MSRSHIFLQMTFNTYSNFFNPVLIVFDEIQYFENNNGVLNQDLRGKMVYDTEKCHAVTFLKHIAFLGFLQITFVVFTNIKSY